MSKEDPGKEDAAIIERAEELKNSGAGQRYEDVKGTRTVTHAKADPSKNKEREQREPGE